MTKNALTGNQTSSKLWTCSWCVKLPENIPLPLSSQKGFFYPPPPLTPPLWWMGTGRVKTLETGLLGISNFSLNVTFNCFLGEGALTHSGISNHFCGGEGNGYLLDYFSLNPNLIPRVFRLFGQRSVARRVSGGTGTLSPQDFCGKTMQAFMEQPIKKITFFQILQAPPGDQPLAKEPQDSGCEIDSILLNSSESKYMYF